MDADNDGLPDWWELLHGLETNNGTGRHGAAGDFDLDGPSNMDEYLFGMNPALADAASMPRVSLVPHATLANAWTLEFPTIPDRNLSVAGLRIAGIPLPGETSAHPSAQRVPDPPVSPGATTRRSCRSASTGCWSRRLRDDLCDLRFLCASVENKGPPALGFRISE